MLICIRCHDKSLDETQITEAEGIIVAMLGESAVCYMDMKSKFRIVWGQSNYCLALEGVEKWIRN